MACVLPSPVSLGCRAFGANPTRLNCVGGLDVHADVEWANVDTTLLLVTNDNPPEILVTSVTELFDNLDSIPAFKRKRPV